jgi:uncharacterized membrane protein (DUF485 family)
VARPQACIDPHQIAHRKSVPSSRAEMNGRFNNTLGGSMDMDLAQRIAAHPRYQELKAKRTSFGWWLTLAMMVAYYGFILLVAFNKEFLSQRLGSGVMTVGIPIGFGVIVFTVVITAIYVKRANREFDDLTADIAKAVLK